MGCRPVGSESMSMEKNADGETEAQGRTCPGCMQVGGIARPATGTVASFCHLFSSRTDCIAAVSKCNRFHLLILTLSQDSPYDIESQCT